MHLLLQWVGLTWTQPQTISRVQVYFFDDDRTVRLPASWWVQYWNGSGFVDVKGASGYPVKADQYNTVTFAPVSTTYVRVVLDPTRSPVGLHEVRVYGS
jgi:hypothetical protein